MSLLVREGDIPFTFKFIIKLSVILLINPILEYLIPVIFLLQLLLGLIFVSDDLHLFLIELLNLIHGLIVNFLFHLNILAILFNELLKNCSVSGALGPY